MSRLGRICKKIRNGQFEFSQHATDQSIIRHISVQELYEAIEKSEIIEDYPNDKYGPSCLILGFTNSRRPLHLQCSYPSRPLVKIITLYEPDPSRWIDFKIRRNKMSDQDVWKETLVEKSVTYSLEVNGRFIIIEDVPARVNIETGEKYFSPETVERLQQAVWEQYQPVRTIETPVYEYTALA